MVAFSLEASEQEIEHENQMEAKLNATQEMKGKTPFQGQVRQTLNYPQTTQSCCATPDGAPQETLSPHFFTFSLWILKRTDFLETFG